MTKKTKTQKTPTAFDLYLYNREWFAKVHFDSVSQVRRFFPGCKIVKGSAVYLAKP
jgi:hypothetical protein